jgi:hypothetical protein
LSANQVVVCAWALREALLYLMPYVPNLGAYGT